jgi:PilZ domain-containing protein
LAGSLLCSRWIHLRATLGPGGQPRFEIVGRLRGSVASLDQLPLINLSAGGALIESRRPLAANSVHSIRLKSGAALQDMMVRVRHVRPIWTAGEQRYLVGLEFLAPESVPHDQHAS